ncbi:histidine kinase internal region (plasmid) [Gemmatirosa kalamazoonensis]|uniref:histidine kinase n=2 Tax=Gemmatirosa kalamazoonensis TaxID=861299 RepID=W0RVN4_9BACT|nr:histidine kinase internal region [Gemmatirosa kalamazoonensis]
MSRAARVAFYVALWTLLALLSALQSAARWTQAGRAVPWAPLLADRFADWYSCALFTPVYFWLAVRAPITRRMWQRTVPVHLAATAVIVVLKYAMYVAAGIAIGSIDGTRGYLATLGQLLARSFVYESMTMWAVDGAVHAIVFYRRAQEREAHAARLRAELTEARMDALSAQLRPHFLFNALNVVSSLMHRDVDAADAVLARLGDLLRRTLRAGDRHEVPLGEELAVLDDYLAIVGARFRDRLTTEVRAEPGTERALVPHFVLQPLVENALEHGIARRAGAGRVEVCAARLDGDRLRLTVADDGAGRAVDGADGAEGNGIGLTNTRRRLAALYGDAQRLTLADRAGGGLVVTVELPWRQAT